ncbi:MAG: response regulator, partial [Thermosynechococcaceae cyanobacterium]
MKILLVEDDPATGTMLTEALTAHHYTVSLATDGTQGLTLAQSCDYDLVLLDVLIPNLDGISVCRQLRTQGHQMPILLLTAKDTSTDRVLGLDAGADDYVVKPFNLPELMARIRALLRRTSASLTPIIVWEKLHFDPRLSEMRYGETLLKLTPKEYGILELLLLNPRRIFSRSVILDRLWDISDSPGEDTVTTHIKSLRRKLKAAGATQELIETMYGLGYRLKPVEHLETPSRSEPLAALVEPPPESQTVQGLMANLWEKFKDTFAEQVAVLVRAAEALSADRLTPELHHQAQGEAHKLAGSLGTYGYPNGSTLAQHIEQLLKSKLPWDPSQKMALSQQVQLLWQELQQPPLSDAETEDITSFYSVLAMDRDRPFIEALKADAIAHRIRIETASVPSLFRTLLTQKKPDVVLLSLSFPQDRVEGFKLLQEMQQTHSQIPVAILSQGGTLADRVEAARLGGRAFLEKPASSERIFQTLNQIQHATHSSEGTVLAVDDDPAVLATLHTLLEPWGLQVNTLNDPQRFWEQLEACAPDLLVLDVEMPTFSGIDLCQVVRNDPRWGDRP